MDSRKSGRHDGGVDGTHEEGYRNDRKEQVPADHTSPGHACGQFGLKLRDQESHPSEPRLRANFQLAWSRGDNPVSAVSSRTPTPNGNYGVRSTVQSGIRREIDRFNFSRPKFAREKSEKQKKEIVNANSGFIIDFDIEPAIKAIQDNPIGPLRPATNPK